MKLCTLCHWLYQRRRWLMLPIGLALALLCCFLLPSRVWRLLAAAIMTISAMLLIYARDLREIFRSSFSRLPRPQDAMAEIVMVDASLVDLGTQLQAAAQPVNPCTEMSMRMGSGALLLGTAMVFLADTLRQSDSDALLAGAAKMNLRAATIRRRSPILSRGTEDGMQLVTVQDGTQERSYFMADAPTVAAACGSIWEDRVRLMGQNDRARILDAAKYMSAGGCRVLAFATATDDERPVFLGLAALGDGLDADAVHELRELRSMGVTLILRDDERVPLDIAALRQNMDVPNLHARPDLCLSSGSSYPDSHCLTIRMEQREKLTEPVQQLRRHFSGMSRMLSRLSRLTGLCLLCCALAGNALSLLTSAAILTAAYLSFGNLMGARRLTWPGMAVTAAGCLAAALMLGAAVPDAAACAGNVMATALTALLSLSLLPRSERLTLRSLLPMALTAVVSLLLHLLLSLPVLSMALLPCLFSLVCAAMLGLLCLVLSR